MNNNIFWNNATHHPMEDTSAEIELQQKYCNQDYTGRPSTKMQAFYQQCDRCQRTGNISKKNEMPLQNILEVELFDVWELISWDNSHLPLEISTYYLLSTMYPSG
ncbi:hypothetical protein GQ457_03G016200 [Hibiscus cannabinus]